MSQAGTSVSKSLALPITTPTTGVEASGVTRSPE
jgi:hypothetical protein